MPRTLLSCALFLSLASACDTTSELPLPDDRHGNAQDGNADGSPSDAPEPVQHASCAMPLPEPMPAQPDFTGSPAGVPRYSSWAELSCDAWPGRLTACSATQRCEITEECLQVNDGDQGVCASFLAPDDGVQQVLNTYREGQCAGAIDPAFKAAACCNGTVGFDCRVFPLAPEAARSAPGELCTSHADCELGLVCGLTADTTLTAARCVCPGVDATLLVEPDDCAAYPVEREWGGPALVFTDRCAPALTEGWVVEVISEDLGEQIRATLAPDGALHVLAGGYTTRAPFPVAHLTLRDGVWSREVMPGVDRGAFALAFDPQGTLHAALGSPLQYATLTREGWQFEALHRYSLNADLAFDASGRPLLAYGGFHDESFEALGMTLATRTESGWSEELVGEPSEIIEVALGFDASGAPRLVYSLISDATANWAVRTAARQDGAFVVGEFDEGGRVSGTRAADGTLRVSYGGLPYYDVRQNVWSPAASVRLARFDGDGVTETVWNHRDPGAAPGMVESSIALDASEQVWIAHQAPQGIVLRGESNHFQTVALAPEGDSAPALVFDAAGEPHVFYGIRERNESTDGDDTVRFAQLRHVHRGSCP